MEMNFIFQWLKIKSKHVIYILYNSLWTAATFGPIPCYKLIKQEVEVNVTVSYFPRLTSSGMAVDKIRISEYLGFRLYNKLDFI